MIKAYFAHDFFILVNLIHAFFEQKKKNWLDFF